MHRQHAAGPLFQQLADLVAVHRPTRAGEHAQDHEGPGPGVQLFLKLAIGRFRVHF